jgi:hypothetical protein
VREPFNSARDVSARAVPARAVARWRINAWLARPAQALPVDVVSGAPRPCYCMIHRSGIHFGEKIMHR